MSEKNSFGDVQTRLIVGGTIFIVSELYPVK